MSREISNNDKMKTYKNALVLLRKVESSVKDFDIFIQSVKEIIHKTNAMCDITNMKFTISDAISSIHRNIGEIQELMDNDKDN